MNSIDITMGAITLMILVIQWVIPKFIDNMLPYGVQIPPERVQDPAVTTASRRYHVGIFITLIISALLWWLLRATAELSLLTFLPLVPIVLGFFAYYIAHRSLRKAKAAGRWMAHHRQRAVTETNSAKFESKVSWGWVIPTAVVIAVTFVIGIAEYGRIPHSFAIHYNGSGKPDNWAVKSISSVFNMVFVQLGIFVLMLVMHAILKRQRGMLDPADPIGSAQRGAQQTANLLRGIWIFLCLVNLGMLWSNLAMWGVVHSGVGTVLYATLIPVLLGLCVLLFAMRKPQSRTVPTADTTSPVRRDEEQNWVLGIFYVNRNDARWLVEKRFGVGWTFNFGHSLSWIVLVGIILIPVLISLVAKWS